MRRVMVFDHEDSIVGELSPDEVLSLVRTEVVNGEHTLTIRTTRVLEIGWRILTKDGMGKWREHVVYGADARHASGETAIGEYYCVWSLMHDLAGTTVSAMPGAQSPVYASVALDAVLGGTSRWVRGDVENTAQAGASMYDMSGWEAMSVLLENWGGEIDAAIEVGASGVTARKVDYYEMQGSSEALRRYDFGADMKSVRRRIEDGILYCRISPRGKGEQTEGGGYGRKITIASVNDGKDYLEYAPMVSAARLPDGSGGWEYPTLIVENSSCETPADLKAWGESVLEPYCTPNVTYAVDVAQASAEGVDMHGVALGDVVHLVDRKFGDGLRLSGRVSSMTVDMLDERNVKVTIGSVSEWLSEALAAFGARFDAVSAKVDAAAAAQSHMATAAYVTELLRRVNAEISASNGWTYIVPGLGIVTYDAAVSDPTVGAEATQVVEIRGGNIRIGTRATAQGSWSWRTVLQNGLIIADDVRSISVTTGRIATADGASYWNLDTGEMLIGDGQFELTSFDKNTRTTYLDSREFGFMLGKIADGASWAVCDEIHNHPPTNVGFTSDVYGLMLTCDRHYKSGQGTDDRAGYLWITPAIAPYQASLERQRQAGIFASSQLALRAYVENGRFDGSSTPQTGWSELRLAKGAATLKVSQSGGASGYIEVKDGEASIHASGSGNNTYSATYIGLRDDLGKIALVSTKTGGANEIVLEANTISTATYASMSTRTFEAYEGTFTRLTVTGTKPRLVKTPDYGERYLYAYETPTPTFGDLGGGKIGDDGLCVVEIDAVFAETADTWRDYQVFLQALGRGELWVAEKAMTHFVVAGAPGLEFDWEIKVRQRDYAHLRMERKGMEHEALDPEYEVHESEAPNPEDAYADDDFVTQMEELYASEIQEAA